MDPYVGEIRIFTGTFAPRDWADCNGQIMSVQQNSLLFSIIGAIYGGNGSTTFALPNLNGRVPMHQGAGPGLTPRQVGEQGGEAAVTLLTTEMPSHAHVAYALDNTGTLSDPTGAVWTRTPKVGRPPVESNGFAATPDVAMFPLALSVAGGSQGHNNMQPYLPVRFIIALQGVYPVKPQS
jgi:microcystin-dependent protein